MNKYTYAVPFTEQQLVHDYVTLRMTQTEIAAKYGTTQKVVWRAMHKMGVPTRVAAKRNQRGAANASWTGGRILMAVKGKARRGERLSYGNGYYYVLRPDHPNCNKLGYVAEHVVVATAARGRALDQGEMVHHIDLDKHNNDPANLAITDAATHAAWHCQLEEIAVEFMRLGLVAFDPLTGYKRKP